MMSPADRHSPDSIDDVLGEDRELLGGLVDRLRRAVLSASPDAQNLALELSLALRMHMSWEDGTLFPAVSERATSAQRRNIESLEIDHERLRDTLNSLDSTLSTGDYATAQNLVNWLETLLKGHNYDEEHGVYVEADQYLTVEERHRIIDRFRLASMKAGP